VESAKELRPDIVILDLSMPELNGIEAAKQIRAALPAAKLIFLSMHSNPAYLRKALEAGANGYVLKAGMMEELLDAIHAALDGRSYFSPGFGQELIAGLLNHSGKPTRPVEDLTDRQLEILQLVAEGKLSKEIAHALEISVKTVEFHRGRIMAKLGARSIAEVVRLAVERGLIPASAPEED
jgi:DNA-binding NarL/FixJ family response regulator